MPENKNLSGCSQLTEVTLGEKLSTLLYMKALCKMGKRGPDGDLYIQKMIILSFEQRARLAIRTCFLSYGSKKFNFKNTAHLVAIQAKAQERKKKAGRSFGKML